MRLIDLDNLKIINMGRDKYGNAIYHIPPDTPLIEPDLHWIPVKWREPTAEESKYYSYMADCPMPEDEQPILITRCGWVEIDICMYDSEFYLDSGEDWRDVTAWMPLPEPWRGEDNA